MADSYAGRISKARSNDDMIFEGTRNIVISAASNEMTMFISNSNVGIGTSNPTARLHVVGNAYINDGLHVLNHSTTGGLRVSKHTSGPFNPNAPSVVMNDAFIEIADRDGYMFSNASSNDIVFFQTNSNQSLQIGASIGARANITLTKSSTVIEAAENIVLRTNGSNALSIGQSGYVTFATGLVTPSFATCNLYTGSGTQSRPSHTFSNDDGTGLFQPGPGSMAIAISSTERIRFNSNGYVGIGTTTPERLLDVNGTVKAVDFMEANVSLANKYAPSNETTTRLNVLDSTSTWTSNTTSNFANYSNTNDAINRIDAMAFTGCNAAIWSSNNAYWLSNTGLPQYALSNDIFPIVTYASNTFSNVTMSTEFTPTSNAAFWASNELLTRPTGVTVDLLYAKSNPTFRSIASNTVRSEWVSNLSVWSSNSIVSTSNALFNVYPTKVDVSTTYATLVGLSNVSSQSTFGCNAGTWASNTLSNTNASADFSSNNSQFASNTAVFSSNRLPNYVLLIDAERDFARSNGQSNWNFGSNTAHWASNAAEWASNTFLTTSIASNNYARSNQQSNWNYASNTAFVALEKSIFSSNALTEYSKTSAIDAAYARSNAQSNWNYASNQSVANTSQITWTSNELTTYQKTTTAITNFAQSNAQSNWVYASNTSTDALSRSIYASNVSTWSSNSSSNYALLSSQSNWIYASNSASATSIKSTWASNNSSNVLTTMTASNAYAASNAQSNWVFGSNTAFWASNEVFSTRAVAMWASNSLQNVATTAGTSNWNYASNAAVWTSNTVVGHDQIIKWTSNSLLDKTEKINNSNWNYASNTAFWASNNTIWTSNALSEKLNIADATVSFAASNTLSNLNYASNTSFWASNTTLWTSNNSSNLLLLVNASNAFALSNAQSNWNYASNTAFDASNLGYWTSNNFSMYTNTVDLNTTLCNYAPSNTVNAALTNISTHLNAASNTVYGCNGAIIIWASNNFNNFITSVAANNTNAAIYGSNTSTWTSNNLNDTKLALSNKLSTLSNTAYTAANNVASNGIAGVYSSNKLPEYILITDAAATFLPSAQYGSKITWTSNTVNDTSNFAYALNTTMFSSFAASNRQSNWNFGSNTASWSSNTAFWGSNNGSNMLSLVTASNAYAASNGQSNWVFASNTSVWGSNNSSNVLRLATASNWVFASNTSVWGSNNASNLLLLSTASNSYAASNAQSNWVFASNTSVWSSNNGSNLLSMTEASNAYAASNAQSNWVFASNTAFWGSNNGSNLLSRTQASNAYAASNAQSNWVFASNTSVWSSNNGSNLLSMTEASNAYAASNAQSNWVFASNTAFWGSNNGSNLLSLTQASNAYAASNAQSNWVFASNTSVWSSNNGSNLLSMTEASNAYAASNAQSNWVFASNTAFWGSNNGSNLLSRTQASNAYAASNAQSNWVFASNTSVWSSNNGSNLLSMTEASNAYAASNAQSNWVFASNTAFWGSNNGSNLLSLTQASNAYAASNAQSNWVFASNTSVAASNVAYWGSNNSGGRYWTSHSSNVTTLSNVGIGTQSPSYRLHVNGGDIAVTNGANSADQGGALNFGITPYPSHGAMAAIQGRLNGASTTYSTLSGGLSFLTRASPSSSNTLLVEAMRIDSLGKVGIGTALPTKLLDVAGECRAQNYSVYNSAAVEYALSNASTTAMLGLAFQAGQYSTSAAANDVILRTGSNQKLLLQSGSGVAGISITGANNIGMGTASPIDKLQVVGGDISVYNGTAAANQGGALNFGTNTNSNYGEMASIKGVYNNANATFSTIAGGMAFFTRANNATVNTVPTEAMRITHDRCLVIGGTTVVDPADILTVYGNIAQKAGTAYLLDIMGDSLYCNFGTTVRTAGFGPALNMGYTSNEIGYQTNTQYNRTSGDIRFYYRGVHSDTQGDPGTGGVGLFTVKGATGNVAIGSFSNPLDRLHVLGDIRAYNGLNTSDAGGALRFGTSNNPTFGEMSYIKGVYTSSNATNFAGGIAFFTRSNNSVTNTTPTERMRITHDGRVGVGITPTAYQFQLSTDSAGKPSTNTWAIVSDARIKQDIVLADNSICYSIVKNIPLKYFKWRDDIYTVEQVRDRHKLGWIAQDVEPILPKAVEIIAMHGYDDLRTLNSDQIIASMYGALQLVQEVQEQHSESERQRQNLIAIQVGSNAKYSVLTSSRCDIVYRGAATLLNGQITVNLDSQSVSDGECAMPAGTFQNLCRNAQYFLQNDSGFARLRGVITGGTLEIMCEDLTSSDVVNWMVVGERKDPYVLGGADGKTNAAGYFKTT
jgi:hypothetical protein